MKPVAQFIANHIPVGTSYAEIAGKLGLESPSIIEKFADGSVKVPLDMAKALAEAIGAEPVAFFETYLEDYMPEIWALFRDVLGEMAMNEHEMEIVRAYRRLAADLARGGDLNVAIVPVKTFITVEKTGAV